MSTIAYELREAYAGTVVQYATEADLPTEENPDGNGVEVNKYLGGVIVTGPDGDLDIREALDEGDGRIVVDEDADHRLILALDEYPPLKRVGTKEGDELTLPYDKRVKPELEALVEQRGIANPDNALKENLVEALEKYDALAEAGELPDELTVDALLEAELPEADTAPDPANA